MRVEFTRRGFIGSAAALFASASADSYALAVGAGRPSVPARKHAASARMTRRDGVFTDWMRQNRKLGGDAAAVPKERR